MKRALLLNSDWTPLNFVSGVRALNLLFKGRAEVISMGEGPSTWEDRITTTNRSYEMPATLRLLERVSRRYTAPRFRKKVLFNRDNWQCQYCGIKLEWGSVTVDHVVPRARGGSTSWKNCVSSCKRCNAKKGAKTPAESGLTLKKQPSDPHVIHFWDSPQTTSWHPDWFNFFRR